LLTRSSGAKRLSICMQSITVGRTRNTRKLEEKGGQGLGPCHPFNERKRKATQVAPKDGHCEIVYWSVRSIGNRGSGNISGQLGITKLGHSHPLCAESLLCIACILRRIRDFNRDGFRNSQLRNLVCPCGVARTEFWPICRLSNSAFLDFSIS